MKNVKNRFRNIIIATFTFLSVLCSTKIAICQSTTDNNTPSIGSFLGWDDTGNTELDILQNNTLRQRFTSVNWTGLNGLSTNNASRIHIGLNGNEQLDGGVTTPFSLLHLGENINKYLRRSWMNVGITLGASSDFMHMGILQRATPTSDDLQADAVIAWGCNDDLFEPEKGPDNLRFLFLTPTIAGPAPGGPAVDGYQQQGRETMRITPMGNVGIGDFSSMFSGLNEQPTQKLDVVGTARLRQMPNNAPDVIITGVEADVAGDYVLNYSSVEEIIPCDWDVVGGGDDVATGYYGACVVGQVLVGTDTQTGSNAKVFMTKDYDGTTLQVEATSGSGIGQTAGNFIAENADGFGAVGVNGVARNAGLNVGLQGRAERGVGNFGVWGSAENAQSINYGVRGNATNTSGVNYGVYGEAEGTEEPRPRNNVGVFGEGFGPAIANNFGGYFLACGGEKDAIAVYGEVCDTTNGIAGYFVGQVQHSQPPISLSDESIKNDLSDIENSLALIGQLHPKQYYFNSESYSHLGLDNSKSYGFSAQEVQQVLPDVVEAFHHPAKYDTSGEMISPSEDLLGIQYQEFIAILTAGIKEQQAQIDEQEQTIDDLQQSLNNQNDLIGQMIDQMDALADQVNDCCEGELKFNPSDEGNGGLNDKPSLNGNVLEQNVPNPFRSQTTISYKLEQGGKVLLNIFDKTGKPITTLVEAGQSAGDYRYEWDASGLPSGLYHYALYVDGELLVKKAIKLKD